MKPLGAKLRQMIEKQRLQIQAEAKEKAEKEAEDAAVKEAEEKEEAEIMTPRTLGDVKEPVPPKPNLVYKRNYPMPTHLNLNDSTKKKINTLLLKR